MDPKVKPTGKRWAVLFVIFLGCVVGSFSQFVTTAFGGYLMDEIGLSTSQFGAITMCPMLTGIIFSIFAGTIADKKGVRFSVFVAGLIGIAGAALRIISASYAMLMISSFLLGFLPVFISSNSAKLISEWFPKRDISIAMGIFMAGGGAGNAIAQAITAYFGTFHNACVVTLFMMVIAYVLFLVIASDRPEGATPPPADVPISQTIGNVLRLKHIWVIGLTMICFMVGNMTVSIYLTTAFTTRGIPVTTAGFVTSAFATGIMIGTIFGGAVILKIGKGKFRIPSLIVGIIGGICVYVGWMLASPAISAVLMFIGALCCGALVPVNMSAMVYIPGMKPEYMGAAGGYANMMRFLAAFVFPSYIIAPIAGNNFNIFMMFAAIAVVLFGVFTLGLPEVLEKQPDTVS
ncbi:MAG: MFS transporter [Thermacetogeniaceae bacterium]|jgi:NNP family nitrate/nitrite transporter-like MFS transporter